VSDHELELERLRLASVLAAGGSITGLSLRLLGASRLGDFVLGWLFNVCALSLLWATFELGSRWLTRARWLLLAFYPWLLALCGLVFAHTWFYDVAIERRLTLLDLTWSGLRYFFMGALTQRGWVALLAFAAALVSSAVLIGRGLPAQRMRARSGALVGLIVASAGLACAIASLAVRVPSPLFDSAFELWELAARPKIASYDRPADQRLLRQLDKSEQLAMSGALGYSKVIVLVMETMTAQNFARERAALPAAGFFAREAARTQHYERYFPNNQDSRTGMLDMLFSRLIPYEAYRDEDYARYRGLALVPSLVDRMRELGFAPAFAVSQTTLEDVVGELPWQETLHLSAADIAQARAANKLCFAPDEWEQSCEDLVLLPAVLDFVARHERAFVYQEFIWGHAAEYNEASGKSNAAYYEAYVDALLAGLATRGLESSTLLAITSDHGFRDKGRQGDLESYRVPLLFHARRLSARKDDRLFTHSDFGALLFERLLSPAAEAPDNQLAMIVGPTGQGHLFVVEPSGHMLVRHKAGLDLLIEQRGTMKHEPSSLLGLFRAYRTRFDARLAQPRDAAR
jgi:hypothetical protein